MDFNETIHKINKIESHKIYSHKCKFYYLLSNVISKTILINELANLNPNISEEETYIVLNNILDTFLDRVNDNRGLSFKEISKLIGTIERIPNCSHYDKCIKYINDEILDAYVYFVQDESILSNISFIHPCSIKNIISLGIKTGYSEFAKMLRNKEKSNAIQEAIDKSFRCNPSEQAINDFKEITKEQDKIYLYLNEQLFNKEQYRNNYQER